MYVDALFSWDYYPTVLIDLLFSDCTDSICCGFLQILRAPQPMRCGPQELRKRSEDKM